MRALRSWLVLSLLFSVACSLDHNDGPCGGCASPHSYGGSGPYPGSTYHEATLEKLVLADGTNLSLYENYAVNWTSTTFEVLGRPIPIGYETDADAGDADTDADADVPDADVDADTADADVPDADVPDADADVVEAGSNVSGSQARMVARIVLSELPTKPGKVVITAHVQVCGSPATRLIGDVCRDKSGAESAPETFDSDMTYDTSEKEHILVTVDDERLTLVAQQYKTPDSPGYAGGTECY